MDIAAINSMLAASAALNRPVLLLGGEVGLYGKRL
jgi:hypothetical protein